VARALLEQPVGVTEQSNKGNERRDAAHACGYASEVSAIAPSAIAIALPPTTLLITATTIAKVKNCFAPLGRHRSVLEHPSSVVVPGAQIRVNSR
jgi:hypothetical protein